MANLKLVKGGKDKGDSDTPDYTNVLTVAILMGMLLGCFWVMILFMGAAFNSPDDKIRFGNQLVKGLASMYIGVVFVALGKEMTLSSKKHITIFGMIIYCLSVGLFFYGGHQWM